jgi:CHRD domain
MNTSLRIKHLLALGLGAAALLLAGCETMHNMAANKQVSVSLSGAEQVPAVNTMAKGSGSFTVAHDHSVSGSVSISGLSAVAAHIHVGARGKNGPVAVGLTKSSDTLWVVPAGAKFTDEQYKAFLAGETYVNFHTAQHKGGEIRAQLQP